MSTIKHKNTIVERAGINHVRTIVEAANCLWHDVHKENDFGIDAIIELVDGEEVKGKCVGVQVKSGQSYVRPGQCVITASKRHFDYWNNYSLPVVGIVFDPVETRAYWANITQRFKNEPNVLDTGPYNIIIDKSDLSEFTDYSFRTFFLPVFLNRRIVLDFAKSLLWAENSDYNKHSIAINSLLAYRDDPRVWDFLVDLFRRRKREETSLTLIYYFSLIPGHFDIFWHPDNYISEEIRHYVYTIFNKFNRNDLLKLISFIQDDGVERGSIGQCVVAIVNHIYGHQELLEDIVSDISIEYAIRFNAVLVYMQLCTNSLARLISTLLLADDKETRSIGVMLRDHFTD